MKKKALTVILSLSLAVALAACGKSTLQARSSQPETKRAQETLEPESLQQLLAPDIIYTNMDGEVLELSWNEVAGAGGYTFLFQDVEKDLQDGKFTITGVPQGITLDFQIMTKGDGVSTTDSVWGTYTYTTPSYSYTEDVGFASATCLSSSQLLEWASANGYTYETSSANGWYVVDVSKEDSVNAGTWNKIKRIGSAAWDGFTDGIDETVDSYTDIDSLVDQYAVSGSIKDTFNDINEEAQNNGKLNAIRQALKSAFMDANIHYIYYYKEGEENRAAKFETVFMIKKNHESFKNDMEKDRSLDDSGRTVGYNEMLQKNYYFVIQETDINGIDFWQAVVYTE